MHKKLTQGTLLVLAFISIGFVFAGGAHLISTQDPSTQLAAVLPAKVTALANHERKAQGAQPLIEDALLTEAAQRAANDMAERGYFAHESPEGRKPWYWLEEVGYGYLSAGQNLAINFNDSKKVHRAWMNSTSHKANILRPVYTHIGIATAPGLYRGREAMITVVYFATPRADQVFTPVSRPLELSAMVSRAFQGMNADSEIEGKITDMAAFTE